MKYEIIHNGKTIAYKLQRKNVKNLILKISNQGELVVSAHPMIAQSTIESFIKSKQDWIVAKQQAILNKHIQVFNSFEDGYIFYLGEKKKIEVISFHLNFVKVQGDVMEVYCAAKSDPNRVLINYMQEQCKELFLKHTNIYLKELAKYDIQLHHIKIKKMKSRWGSCTPSKHTITLNQNLIHYPVAFIEYVILHELVHFIHLNHSSAFYATIASYMPDYKARIALSKA